MINNNIVPSITTQNLKDPKVLALCINTVAQASLCHHYQFLAQETLMTLNFLKVIRNSSLKLLFLDFKLSLVLI